MQNKIITAVGLLILTACSFGPFKVININTTDAWYQEVNHTLDKCVKFVQPYFDMILDDALSV